MTRQTLRKALGAACAALAGLGAADAHASARHAPRASHGPAAGALADSPLIQVVSGSSRPARAEPTLRLYLIGWIDAPPAPPSRAAEIRLERANPSRDGRSR